MNAAQIIEEIDSMPVEEKNKVVAYVLSLKEKRYHLEQLKVIEQRLDRLEKGETQSRDAFKVLDEIRGNLSVAELGDRIRAFKAEQAAEKG